MDGASVFKDGGEAVLSGISWRIRNGEHWVVFGLNGSGKTTLLNLIAGYVQPATGRMDVLGRTFGRYDWRALRREIGFASSSLAERLYADETALEIVLSGLFATIGLYEEAGWDEEEKAVAALDLVGISGLSGRRYAGLSQGERQKVLIARALVNSPRLLLLDEPCAGLDLFAREKVLSCIQHLAQKQKQKQKQKTSEGPAMVMVSHHIEEVVSVFTHALLLEKGRVHSHGLKEDVLTQKNLSSFFGAAVRIRRKAGRFHIALPDACSRSFKI